MLAHISLGVTFAFGDCLNDRFMFPSCPGQNKAAGQSEASAVIYEQAAIFLPSSSLVV